MARHFMNPAVGRHLQGAQPPDQQPVDDLNQDQDQDQGGGDGDFTGRLHITHPDGQEQVHHFTADDHDGLLDQIHQFLQGGTENMSLADTDAMESGGSQSSSGGVHAHARNTGSIPD